MSNFKIAEHGRMDANWVSIWLGTSPTFQALADILTSRYDDDGEPLGSPFSQMFKLGHVDEDLVDALTFTPTDSVAVAFSGCSDEQEVIAAVEKAGNAVLPATVDCAVIIYHFNHQGLRGTKFAIDSVFLQFLGAFELARVQ